MDAVLSREKDRETDREKEDTIERETYTHTHPHSVFSFRAPGEVNIYTNKSRTS